MPIRVLKKIVNFWRKPPEERRRRIRARSIHFLVNRFGAKHFLRDQTFLAYHPDSHVYSPAHPEFTELFRKFTVHNELNNGGDVTRLWSLILNLKQVLSEGIEGDFAELGVWRGNTAALLNHFASQKNRQVFLFDTYEGFNEKDITGVDSKEVRATFSDTSVELVKGVVGPNLANCHFVKGYFPDSISAEAKNRKYAVVSLDCDLYKPMKAGLEFFYPRMSKGAILFLHDYSSPFWDGARIAVNEFCAVEGENIILLPDKSGSAVLRKSK